MDQRVQRALATRVALQSRTPQHLERHQLRLLGELLDDEAPERLGLGRTPDPSQLPLGFVVDVTDRGFSLDALNASDGDSGQLCYLRQAVSRPPQNLDFVALEQVDHPFPRRLERRVWTPTYSGQGGQNFRKGPGQNFWNPQGSRG